MAKDPSKTEQATKKRVDKARKDGSVPKSQDFGKVVTLIVGLICLYVLIHFISTELRQLFSWFLSNSTDFQMDKKSVHDLFILVVRKIAVIVLPVLLTLALTAILVMRLQVGKLWTTKVLQPKFGKTFNIFGGLKRIVSPSSFVGLIRSLLQAVAVGFAPYIILKKEIGGVLPLFYQNAEGIAAYILTLAFKMVLYALGPMLVIGLADLVYSRWKYNEDLKMTKDEVKDERKQAEGDPKIKMQQRQKMMGVMQQRMLQNVPKADVVVTNPTHYAVALSYNPMEAPAPLVLAKGVDHMAAKIKEIARENNIPIKENRPLARALYDQVEIGEVIPEELYQAVAAILSRLHKFKRQ